VDKPDDRRRHSDGGGVEPARAGKRIAAGEVTTAGLNVGDGAIVGVGDLVV
jgi:hypothetical protein